MIHTAHHITTHHSTAQHVVKAPSNRHPKFIFLPTFPYSPRSKSSSSKQHQYQKRTNETQSYII